MTNEPDASDDAPAPDDQPLSAAEFRAVLETLGRPVATASGVARVQEWSQTAANDALDALVDSGHLDRLDVNDDPRIWYPREFADLVSREHVVVFPDRRELVVEHPEQFTRAQLTQFASLVDSSGNGAYIYEIREEDVWWAPYDHVDDLVRTMRSVLPERAPKLEEWVESQWRRARRFALTTHPDGYTILEAESPELMGNVARQKLDADLLHGPISDTESWVVEGKEGEIKRTLYDAGYPVQDARELEGGADLDIDLGLELRDYQRDWVERFLESGAGVLVGPPGSGKTVAAIGAMREVGGETLILAPSRELAGQWRTSLLANTDLEPDQIGEYHGGEKRIRPVTIATYRTAGMERHRALFDERRWGLIVYDEVHHIPAAIYRKSVDLQAKHRLGLSVSGETVIPVRQNGSVTMEFIEDFVSEHLDDRVGVSSVTDVETLGVTADGSVVWTPVTAAMRHENDAEMYTVRASNGREVTVTSDHSLMVFDGETGSIESKRPDELRDDDYLLQPLDTPLSAASNERIAVTELLDKGYALVEPDAPESVFDPLYERAIGSNKDRYNWVTRRSLPLDIVKRIGLDLRHLKGIYVGKRTQYVPPTLAVDDLARIVGLFLADGTLGGTRVEFYAEQSDRKDEVPNFESVIRSVVPDAEISRVQNGENCVTLRVSGPLVRIFERLGLSNGSRTKSIPGFILANSRTHEAFLEGMVLGDGHRQNRERNRSVVTISTSSERLVGGINFVLASLGFVGGTYRRSGDVDVRPGSHDVVENSLVRYNPENRTKEPRNAMIPFTEELREAFASIKRVPPAERWAGVAGETIDSGMSDRSRLSSDEIEMICDRSPTIDDWLTDLDLAFLHVDSVTRAADEEYVYDISTGTESFLGDHLFCHNSATPVREDDKGSEIFTLIGPPIGTDWAKLFEAGFVAEPEVELRFVPWGSAADSNEYESVSGHERRRVAGSNPAKLDAIRTLLDEHADAKALVFVEWLDQGRTYAEALGVPFISGDTPHPERERLFDEFRRGARSRLIVSRVGDEGIDLPNAEVAIVASGLGGSRRQASQRAGRTMRPAGSSRLYVLATRGTREEDFARQQLRHLAGKGIRLTETEFETE